MFVAVSAPSGTAPAIEADPTPTPRRRIRPGALAPYLYVLPGVAFLILWTYSPLVQTFGLSFYDWNLLPTSPKTFVGFDNYVEVAQLPELHTAITNTVVYVAAFLVFSLVLPIVIAMLAKQVQGRMRTFYQALIFVPFLVTPVATGAVWRWLFAEQGAFATVLAAIGIDMPNVFRDETLAIWAVVVIVGWQMLGFGVLVVAAGFAGISPEYGQAASLDGAGNGAITRKITLPLLSPTIVFLALMTILLAAQWTYPIIDLLTQGGPTNSTTNIYYLLYQFGFQNFDAGISAAAGVIFFIGFGVIALVFLELQDRLSFYDN
ncbi:MULTISPECIES: carbohydrate ABC transporter permease [Actinomycetes]|uniref:Glycerol-3-phosphate ABC transporter permease n=1 Tax=Corynebacterium doosanense CAU 212 = DSM 45436 TaxID=558173 RepID=A0A097ID20_9CORY|nr:MULTISPECIES: sugar ABC transporter permease [Actinomycetes]AIT60028.1 glycerol-3-phosphate ABC transporter permease [Corynebacterium doosanense CAU 212 = DSM 45436]MCE7481945.1 sugar ABC transporter permease [Microbacterium profundi]